MFPKLKNDDKSKRDEPRIRWWLVAGGLLVAALVTFMMITPADPLTAAPADELVYITNGTPVRMNFVQQTLTNGVAPDGPENRYNVVSPDGQWVADWEWVNEYYERRLRLTPTDGGTPRFYGSFFAADDPLSWSPDSDSIAFAAYPPEGEFDWATAGPHTVELWILGIETGDVRRLTHNDYMDSDPFFSPDGTQIAYISSADGFPRLYVMEMATGESRLLTPHYYGDNPQWSPDGEWLAFEGWANTDGTEFSHVVIVRADGSHEQSVSRDEIYQNGLVGWATPAP